MDDGRWMTIHPFEAMAVNGIADAETVAEAAARQNDNPALSTLVRVWIIPVVMTARYMTRIKFASQCTEMKKKRIADERGLQPFSPA
jgi:hypothetical protein